MTLSGWTRLWLVAAALVAAALGAGGCSQEQDALPAEPTLKVTEARLWQFKAACKDFQTRVRKAWEVSTPDPIETQERATIEKMRDACTEFEKELFLKGVDVF